MKKKAVSLAFIIVSFIILGVSAYVYETAQQTITQTVQNIATLTLQNSALGNIEEGQTISYTKATVSSLGNILNITTTKDNVYLHFDSDVNTLSTYYTTYTITVKYAAVGSGSTHVVGDTAATMTIGAPDPAGVTLDVDGAWRFDFELTTTAKSVSSDQATTATITVTAEST
ncbi:MAG TPA: hypothetical protein VJL33_07280 [Candidatus Bathyarchaeia archaeon]|nr:hypothetical protein [Candidatus Bathyarchaeia archaeon]